MSLLSGHSLEDLRAYGLRDGELIAEPGQVFRVVVDGSVVEVRFEKLEASLQGIRRVGLSDGEVGQAVELLSGAEVARG